jgi:three-Cys-motif partner protein
LQFDEIGYWSEIKLDIVRDYATAYSKILATRRRPSFFHVYIDAFAGAGQHFSKTKGVFVLGSPLNALYVQPPFREYYFIDLDQEKVVALHQMVGDQPHVWIYAGDCNAVLLRDIFPRVKYEEYRRGLCLLDPYGLHLQWSIIQAAGAMRTLDLFLNFPLADMNRNVLWHHPERVEPTDLARMNAFWGDDSWRQIAYTTERNLFGFAEKVENESVAEGFRRRLRTVAGFQHVPRPLPMRNSHGAIVYYLFFASQQPVAAHIVDNIFTKYRERGVQ